VRGRAFRKEETAAPARAVGAGSRFERAGDQSAARVAVVSESTVRRFWPAEDPIGKRFQLDMDFRGTLVDFEVVGVAQDVRYANLTRIDPAHVYLAGYTAASHGVLLRVRGDATGALSAVRESMEGFDALLAADASMMSVEDGPVRLQRALARAYGLFAAVLALLALVLAGVGIYGVMAYLVSRRVKEIGIRMALGATRRGVLKGVLFDGLRPVIAGLATGMIAAAALASVLRVTLVFPASSDLFYGVPFYDPATLLGLSCFLAAVAALAALVPAWRALRVDPLTALRQE